MAIIGFRLRTAPANDGHVDMLVTDLVRLQNCHKGKAVFPIIRMCFGVTNFPYTSIGRPISITHTHAHTYIHNLHSRVSLEQGPI